ncbi:pupal cuticle protein C1B [Drosophila erecta]|uniref:pupal cuticle protein C1B n=1 Tax=Drosophila erecta TaxID=7220 RepID=UPI000177FE87|nr:pupal cuticle protein C1B [Drosophila erecta]
MAYFQFLSAASSLLLLLAPAWAGLIAQPTISYAGDEHAVAHTQQNVVRSFDGTVSHYAKSLATPYSQVHKQDTRISNNVYQPALAKTFSYAPAPAPVSVSVPAPVYAPQAHDQEPAQLFTQASPVYHQPAQVQAPSVYHQAAQVQTPSVYHQTAHVQTPSVYHQPAQVQTPSVYHQPAQVQSYHQPGHVEAPSAYHQNAHYSHQPAVIHYSPAETVSHMSFDGFGTHYGF